MLLLNTNLKSIFPLLFKDAPLETAETHWILRAQCPSSLLSLVKLLKESWGKQFNVELPQILHPMLEVLPLSNNSESDSDDIDVCCNYSNFNSDV